MAAETMSSAAKNATLDMDFETWEHTLKAYAHDGPATKTQAEQGADSYPEWRGSASRNTVTYRHS